MLGVLVRGLAERQRTHQRYFAWQAVASASHSVRSTLR